MSHTIPERFLGHQARLLVIHDLDFQKIEIARMSLYALVSLVGEETPNNCRLSIDREQLAHLLETVAEKLDNIPEVFFSHVVQSRSELQTQGA